MEETKRKKWLDDRIVFLCVNFEVNNQCEMQQTGAGYTPMAYHVAWHNTKCQNAHAALVHSSPDRLHDRPIRRSVNFISIS